MAEIRTSLRVMDLPPRRGTYENLGTAYSEYEVQRALVATTLEARLEAGESMVKVSKAAGLHPDTVRRLIAQTATMFSVDYAYSRLLRD